MKTARPRIDVNLDELDRVLDGARQAPLREDDYEKLKDALHALAAMLVRPRTTEKTSAVLEKLEGAVIPSPVRARKVGPDQLILSLTAFGNYAQSGCCPL
jgi:hypothetical protein